MLELRKYIYAYHPFQGTDHCGQTMYPCLFNDLFTRVLLMCLVEQASAMFRNDRSINTVLGPTNRAAFGTL